MKEAAYGEMYLWNRGVDRLMRVLQRLEAVAIRPRRELKAYEVRLEEIRAGLNADFATATGLLERGKSIPRLNTLLIVAELLGVSVSELLQGLSRG